MITLERFQAIRDDTPGLRNVLHFDSAGASLVPFQVSKAVSEYREFELSYGGYRAQEHHTNTFRDVRSSVGQLLNASSNEIAFMSSATEAWNRALQAVEFKAGDTVLTSELEYANNIAALLQLSHRLGIRVKYIPYDSIGRVCIARLEQEIDSSVRLIAINHIRTDNGILQPAREIGKIARKHKIPYLLDACQSVGQIPVDAKAIGCDFLSATGRKYLRAPRGTGFLYVASSVKQDMQPLGLSSSSVTALSKHTYSLTAEARRFEYWERSYSDLIGLGAACRYALTIGIPNIWQEVIRLSKLLRYMLTSLRGVKVYEAIDEPTGITTLSFAEVQTNVIYQRLLNAHVNCSLVRDPFDSECTKLRLSVHYYNSVKDIEDLLSKLVEAIN